MISFFRLRHCSTPRWCHHPKETFWSCRWYVPPIQRTTFTRANHIVRMVKEAGERPKSLPQGHHLSPHTAFPSSTVPPIASACPTSFTEARFFPLVHRNTAPFPPFCRVRPPHNPNAETDQLLEGRTGEYAEATADEFLDNWLKTDADRARDAAAASAAAAASVAPPGAAGTLSSHGPRHYSANHAGGTGPTDPVSRGYGGTDRRSSAAHHKSGTHTTLKKRRYSKGHGHGSGHHSHGHHHDHDRPHGGGGRHAHDSGIERSSHNPARAERTSGSESEGGRSPHARHGGDGQKSLPHRRRNAATGLVSPSSDISRSPHADSQEPAGERHHRRNRPEKGLAPLEVPSRDKSSRIHSAAEHTRGRRTEAGECIGSPNARPQTQTGSKPPNQAEDDAEEQGSLRRANGDTAQLRETVERLKSELDSLKASKAGTGIGGGGMVGVAGDGLGSNGTNSGFLFGGAAAPVGGSPWQAGEMRQGATCSSSLGFVFGLTPVGTLWHVCQVWLQCLGCTSVGRLQGARLPLTSCREQEKGVPRRESWCVWKSREPRNWLESVYKCLVHQRMSVEKPPSISMLLKLPSHAPIDDVEHPVPCPFAYPPGLQLLAFRSTSLLSMQKMPA